MAGKKRGLSLEDKRTRMLEIFYQKKDVFQLKELEKIGPQEKGIVAQSVKDVVQGLADDGYIDSERIGTSTYFWALPSKATQVRKRKLEQLDTNEKDFEGKKEQIVQEAKKAKLSRNETPEREAMIQKIVALKKNVEKLKELLKLYEDSDPVIVKKERADIENFKACANRWTDNIFTYRTWLRDKFNMSESELNKAYSIPEELDYVNEVPQKPKKL